MTVTETLTPPLGSQDALGHLSSEGRALLFTDARTANSFAPTPVTDQDLAGIWDLAKWGPSAANTQPLRVLYVRTPEGKARLLPHMSEGNRDKTASAPAVAVLARDTRFHEHIPTVLPFRPEMREVFEENEEMRHGIGTFERGPAGGVLHHGRTGQRPGCRPHGWFRGCRSGRRVLPRRALDQHPGGQHRAPRCRPLVRAASPSGP